MKRSFLWGAATSAHQVEGNNIHNDWWQWEQSTPGVQASERAANHFNRFEEDFALAASLGHNAHRLSIEWSRIEPEHGHYSQPALEHYRQVLQSLKDKNMATFVSLHHFTSPLWLARRGGWANRDTVAEFDRYVRYVVTNLQDLVDYWITINEPMVYATESYWKKRWPPQQRSLKNTLGVISIMAAAHRRSYRTIHQIKPDARVGIAKNIIAYQPARDAWVDRVVTDLQCYWFNHRFYRLTKQTHDFLGVNFYFAPVIEASAFPLRVVEQKQPGDVSDLGWPIRPEALLLALRAMDKYKLPIYITENGLADADDTRRSDYIRDHLRVIERAQSQGVDVRGYLHWSLLDNFEWSEGYGPRFGLVAVDYNTMARTPRQSAYVYKAIIDQASAPH